MEYFLDESGNTGDLVNERNALNFGGQPIFALASLGIDSEEKRKALENVVSNLFKKFGLDEVEIKSKDLYFKHPEFILDLISYLVEERFPIFVEVVDKRYCIAFSILTHQIAPAYSFRSDDELTAQVLNIWADYLASNLPDICFEKFLVACKDSSFTNISESMQELLIFCEERSEVDEAAPFIAKLIKETINDYREMREGSGDHANSLFVPIPDYKGNGDSIALIPHVHSIYNIFARLNKYHLGDMDDLTLYHDRQDELKEILIFCSKNISDPEKSRSFYETDHADYRLSTPVNLDFMDSEDHIGIQVADVLAGFINRYVNGLLYKKIKVESIYDTIFGKIRKYNRPKSPLGVNFVIPESRRQVIFDKFSM